MICLFWKDISWKEIPVCKMWYSKEKCLSVNDSILYIQGSVE